MDYEEISRINFHHTKRKLESFQLPSPLMSRA
ncbi:hypothetical protein CBR59_11265 [Bacillus thuringiensis]|uniref:Uncharacterized protein n=1 Tax=Bacillus thuringiensis serovar subtoxicus TaxID=475791 RepID=A0A9X6FR58_BACTU|nr:hypothetical protein BK721_21505 [Bacillus thuringiensis serovar nigeriensis]OTY65948.1 hypothetical protein BK753_21315 [Bacillus thuringiensis serovar canadensis]OTY99274.1 hypothetical protein BK754_04865 [Bacillus thuringiensis serovar subtoxicus]OUA56669.1 hypothetical protein BK781_17855 [Bacillus thuringiensis serovar aizawai]PDY04938.1 hypothetical protein COM66_15245 [Bacillus cereus]PNK28498.1 hypothetical protein CBP87_15505 [Bacillus thuringiensis]